MLTYGGCRCETEAVIGTELETYIRIQCRALPAVLDCRLSGSYFWASKYNRAHVYITERLPNVETRK